MKRNRFPLRFAYLLMGTLLLSTGVLYYCRPWGVSLPSQATTGLSLSPALHNESSKDLQRVRPQSPAVQEGPIHVIPKSVHMINRFYEAYEAGGQNQNIVPRLFSVSFPSDIRSIKNSQSRRQVFIKMVLPLILKTNEEVLAQRARLLAIAYRQHHGLPTLPEDRTFIRQIAHEYKMPTASVTGLLKRVDQVPPSLALAQAMLESGYGTSCAALDKCSIFGHMATLTRVQSFPTLVESVKVYVRNLNRNPAYADFRSLRQELREKSKPLSGHVLAGGLKKYSVRGLAYTREVQKMIRLYNLEKFDGSVLQQPLTCERG